MLGEIKPVRADDNFSIWCGLRGKISVFRWSASLANTGDSVRGPVERHPTGDEGCFPCHCQNHCSQQYNTAKPLTHQCGVCSSAHNIRLCSYMSSLLSGTDNTEHHHACGGIACWSQGLKRPFARTRSLKAIFHPLVSLAQSNGALVFPTDVDVRYKMSWPRSTHRHHPKLPKFLP